MWRHQFSQWVREHSQPEIDPSRCVHGRSVSASCRACVDACPREALILGDEGLGLDLEACDGCRLCAPVCPEGAIDAAPWPEPLSEGVAAIACERAALSEGERSVPCLHALGLRELLQYYLAGVRELSLCSGDCGQCERAAGPDAFRVIDALNRQLDGRGHQPLRVDRLSPEGFRQRRQGLVPARAARPASRRRFLRDLAGGMVEEGLRAAELLDETAIQAGVGEQWLQLGSGEVVPWRPRIEAEHCTGCDACLRICPHGVLALEAGGTAYRVAARHCSGCGLCVDLCDADAIRIEEWSGPEEERIELQTGRCPACGVPFHRPVAEQGGAGLCRICTRVNHSRALYQVLP